MGNYKFDDRVVDLFTQFMEDWDETCRISSSTGENMVLESMSEEEYGDMQNNFYACAIAIATSETTEN